MADLIVVVLLLAALGCVRWLLWDLRTVPVGSTHGDRAVSVSEVIPARDEEKTVPTLLRSLRRLTVAVSEIVVIDDGSRDATASVARSAGAVVLPAGARPP